MNAKTGNQLPADYLVTGGGTVYLFHPHTKKATEWLAEYCPKDSDHQYFGNALVIEHRYVADILKLAIRDGLTPPRTGKEAA
jgi:hypothetical protein